MLCFCGCALRHTSEIERLGDYGRNSNEQKRYVEAQNKKFEELVDAIRKGQISAYTSEEDFVKKFGPPIFEKNVFERDDYAVRWLYRYSQKMFGSEKVYLYFDSAGNLVAWEHQSAEIR
jgi:hypothetical protein